jgi:hypothetical protein
LGPQSHWRWQHRSWLRHAITKVASRTKTPLARDDRR